MRTNPIRVHVQTDAHREMAARAADEAIWLAIHLAERAGWSDVCDRLLEAKQLSFTNRRRDEGRG